MAAFQPTNMQNGFHAPPNPNTPIHHSWRHFADTVIPSMSSQDYMNSNHMNHTGMDMSAAASVASMGSMPILPEHQQPWPLIHVYNPPGDTQ